MSPCCKKTWVGAVLKLGNSIKELPTSGQLIIHFRGTRFQTMSEGHRCVLADSCADSTLRILGHPFHSISGCRLYVAHPRPPFSLGLGECRLPHPPLSTPVCRPRSKYFVFIDLVTHDQHYAPLVRAPPGIPRKIASTWPQKNRRT